VPKQTNLGLKQVSFLLRKEKSFSALVTGVGGKLSNRAKRIHRQIETLRLRRRSISKTEFIYGLKNAIENRAGYAAGKIGMSQKYLMYYEILLRKERNVGKIKKFESDLIFHGLKQGGIFPPDPHFYLDYNKFYIEQVRNLDCLGICYDRPQMEREIIKYYHLKNKLIFYPNQEPDKSSPSNEANCYLPFFKDRKLLIICPFGDLLKSRATKQVFEAVWLKTGKKWFNPKNVEAIEFPYGFSAETHAIYPTALDLFGNIKEEIQRKDFDIALIAGAGLAIPIASYIKSIGKIGIDLGGHLQILFGVIGQRWRQLEDWKSRYFNDSWIDMPNRYKPKETDVCDRGAYW